MSWEVVARFFERVEKVASHMLKNGNHIMYQEVVVPCHNIQKIG